LAIVQIVANIAKTNVSYKESIKFIAKRLKYV
jgi:hypothetical protein